MPEPLQEGSRRLRRVDVSRAHGASEDLKGRGRDHRYSHMRDTVIRLIVRVDGQEVRIYRSHIPASRLADHGLKCLKSPLVALKREQLECPRSISPSS